MELITPSWEIIQQPSYDLKGAFQQIERIGRISHKSEDRITEDSYETFVNNLINWGHTACLEQGTIYLFVPVKEELLNTIEGLDYGTIYDLFLHNPYSIMNSIDDHINETGYYITTNYRVLYENDALDLLKYVCEPTENHNKRYCVKFTCSRAISLELVRHRVFSFLQESQRYVNYKNKRGIRFIQPLWYNPLRFNRYYKSFTKDQWTKEDIFYNNCCESEYDYFSLLDKGLKPQEAREVLINATKTEICMTGFTTQWEEFFKLRCDNAAHPEMRRLTIPLKEEFIKRGYINNF